MSLVLVVPQRHPKPKPRDLKRLLWGLGVIEFIAVVLLMSGVG